MTQAKQLTLLKPRTEHGGDLRQGRRKCERPVDPKRALHIVFRSTKAVGALSFLHPSRKRRIDQTVRELASRNQVQLREFANVGNHLHLVIRGKNRQGIQNFLRAVGSRIALLTTGARKGKPFGRFWDALAYSRVVEWGRALKTAIEYVVQNRLEAEGVVPYRPRKQKRRLREAMRP